MARDVRDIFNYLSRWVIKEARAAGIGGFAKKAEETPRAEKAYPGNADDARTARTSGIYRNDGKLEDFLANLGLVPVMRPLDEYPYTILDYREFL